MSSAYRIRRAGPPDLDTLVAFTLQGAVEAEGREKDRAAVTRGVSTALENPSRATYWVAESPEGQVVAGTSIVREWSDWHGADYWWIQSLFIVPDHRGRGLVDLLIDHLADAARAAGALDLRLYAHNANRRALDAYRRCGFEPAPYTIMTRSLNAD